MCLPQRLFPILCSLLPLVRPLFRGFSQGHRIELVHEIPRALGTCVFDLMYVRTLERTGPCCSNRLRSSLASSFRKRLHCRGLFHPVLPFLVAFQISITLRMRRKCFLRVTGLLDKRLRRCRSLSLSTGVLAVGLSLPREIQDLVLLHHG